MKRKLNVFDYHKAKRGSPVTAYVFIRSSNGEEVYTVVKYKDRKYMCTCPDCIFRRRHCKHIKAFKEAEVAMRLRKEEK